MFIVDQQKSAAYRAEKITYVRVCGKEHGFLDGWIYAGVEGLTPKAGEVELGVYRDVAIADSVMKTLVGAMSGGFPDVFYMPKDVPGVVEANYYEKYQGGLIS